MNEQKVLSKETEDRRNESSRRNRDAGFAVLVTQTLAAVLIILFGLVFRWIGGSAFEQLQTQLARVFTDNTIVDTVLSWCVPPADTESDETPFSQIATTADGLSAVVLSRQEVGYARA